MIAIIGGSGLNELEFEIRETENIMTVYGAEPVPVNRGLLCGREVCFLPRHGKGHTIPPHVINYRSNIDALKQLNVEAIFAVNAVGGIHGEIGPGVIAIPDQIIDYTWGREHTFFDGTQGTVEHVDLTDPYDEDLRQRLLSAARQRDVPVFDGGVYGATQGPRLESRAEVRRLQRDGCDMVGMTGMPEASLAREAGIPYACIALSVNWAAGLTEELITMESIYAVLGSGMGKVHSILEAVVAP